MLIDYMNIDFFSIYTVLVLYLNVFYIGNSFF